MSEAILTFQAQLTGVMETVLKTAVFEISWLVESSFQREAARAQREADALRQRLQAAERRCRAVAAEGRGTCERCGQATAGGAERRAVGAEHREAPPDGVEEACGVKEEEEVGRTSSSCAMDLPYVAARASFRPPETVITEEEGGPCLQEGSKVTVESGSHVYDEDTPSRDSTPRLGEQGCEGGPDGPKFAGPAPEYAAYDRAVIGRGESGGALHGHGSSLLPMVTDGEGIQIANVISLSCPQPCSANHVRRRLPRKVCQSAGTSEPHAAAPLTSLPTYPPPGGDARTLPAVATGDKQLSCAFCGRSFGYASRLKIHLLKHTGEKPFGCGVCGKRFTIARNLERHRHIHRGEAAHGCAQCGKRFKRADHLKVHQRVHTGERPYGCGACGKRFRFSGDLNTHRRTHTGEKPYGCAVCGGRFGQLRQLKAHHRAHHKGGPPLAAARFDLLGR